MDSISFSTIQRVVILEKRLLKSVISKQRNVDTSPLFKQSSILKLQDKADLENILFVIKHLNTFSSLVFNTWFSFSSDLQNYETSSSRLGKVIKPFKT